MKYTDIRGIIVPILTPMDENEQINLPVLREQIERMIVGGVNGIFPLGTNGEAYILSEKEKLEVLETAIDQVAGRVPVYAGYRLHLHGRDHPPKQGCTENGCRRAFNHHTEFCRSLAA